jgi:hypothetical protein
MIDSLAKILLKFPGSLNRVRCLTHVVNLVAKLILPQFDASERSAKDHDDPLRSEWPEEQPEEAFDAELAELIKDAAKEEKDMDEGGDADAVYLEQDLDEVEAAMSEEVKDAQKLTKPVRLVLFKVCYDKHNVAKC